MSDGYSNNFLLFDDFAVDIDDNETDDEEYEYDEDDDKGVWGGYSDIDGWSHSFSPIAKCTKWLS